MLVNPVFPLIFESINGRCETETNSTSFYNIDEIAAVLRYVRQLIPGKWNGQVVRCADIGIISPYRSQCERIRAECEKEGFKNISIGSAEKFQGQEKPIIIVSTVRTDGGTLGFVKDPQVRQNSK